MDSVRDATGEVDINECMSAGTPDATQAHRRYRRASQHSASTDEGNLAILNTGQPLTKHGQMENHVLKAFMGDSARLAEVDEGAYKVSKYTVHVVTKLTQGPRSAGGIVYWRAGRGWKIGAALFTVRLNTGTASMHFTIPPWGNVPI